MKVLIVNNAEKGISEFVKPIEKILSEAKKDSDTINYSEISNTSIEQYNAIILSASSRGNDIVEHHSQYYQWIKSCNKPILGICAGHQIIGKLFESQLIKNKESERGDVYTTIDKADPLFNGHSKRILVRQEHNDSITLPKEFTALAHSDKCRVQMMKHKTKHIYTTQFHAEILNKKIILNFLDIAKNK